MDYNRIFLALTLAGLALAMKQAFPNSSTADVAMVALWACAVIALLWPYFKVVLVRMRPPFAPPDPVPQNPGNSRSAPIVRDVRSSAESPLVPSDADSITQALRGILLRQHLAEARDLGSKTNNSVSAVLSQYRNFLADIQPFSRSFDFPDSVINDFDLYRQLLSTLPRLDSSNSAVVEAFNARIATGLTEYYKSLHQLLGELDEKIETVRQRIAK